MDASLNNLEPVVAAAAAGDRTAFAELVTETSGVVSSIALAIVHDIDVSRDIAQDVFLAAWRDLRKLRNPNSFLPWLRQLTRNRAHHVLRTDIRRKRRFPIGSPDDILAAVADGRPDPASRLIAADPLLQRWIDDVQQLLAGAQDGQGLPAAELEQEIADIQRLLRGKRSYGA